jgi:hypothetical protein
MIEPSLSIELHKEKDGAEGERAMECDVCYLDTFYDICPPACGTGPETSYFKRFLSLA